MDLTFEQWVEVVYQFLKGENTYTISQKLGIVEADLVDFEDMFLKADSIDDLEFCFGDTLMAIGYDMIERGYDADYIVHRVSTVFKINPEYAKELVDYNGLLESETVIAKTFRRLLPKRKDV